ncbi:MAG: RNA-binding S4 domain-containing protein [Bacteroidia bacterium]
MQEFEISGEYIELNKLIKLMQWTETGGQANQVIEEGLIKVNGKEEFRKRNKLRSGDVIVFDDEFSVKIVSQHQS